MNRGLSFQVITLLASLDCHMSEKIIFKLILGDQLNVDNIYDDGGGDDEDDDDNDDDDDDKRHLSGRGLASTSLVATLTINRPGCLTLVGDRLVKKVNIVIIIIINILTHLIVLIFSLPFL